MTANFISRPLPAAPGHAGRLRVPQRPGQGAPVLLHSDGLRRCSRGRERPKHRYTTFNSGNTGGAGLTTRSPPTRSTGGTCASTASQLRTYINSTVGGYVITPYTITLHTQADLGLPGRRHVEQFGQPREREALDPDLCDYTPRHRRTASKTSYKNVVTAVESTS